MKNFFEYILNHPKKIVSIFIFFCSISIFYSLQNLKVNTSTDELISNKLNFKKNQKKLKESFKILSNNILIRIKYDQDKNANYVSRKILSKLKTKEFTDFVYSPNTDEIFKENFFLFMNDSEKESIINKLYDYQPFLTEINNHENRLEGFNNLLELSLKNDSQKNQDFKYILDIFFKSLSSKKLVDWQNLFSSNQKEIFILFGIKQNYLDQYGFENIYNYLMKIKANEFKNIDIDFTGGLIIDFEEVDSVSSGAIYSGILSFILVGVLLWFAFKNILVIVAILSTIFIGLSITICLTTILIGSLNLISIAFAVLFIGLSVDFGIQVCSRIFEKNIVSKGTNISIGRNISQISKILIIAAVPSIVGFISFIPTHYIGLSELGIISAIGLIVGLILNITFLPSLLRLIFNKLDNNSLIHTKNNIFRFIFKFQNTILLIFLIIFTFSIFNVNKISFDSDALNLKDQSLQSVKLAKELIEKNPTSDYIASVVLNNDKYSNFDNEHPILEDENIKSYFSFAKIFQKYESEELDYLKFLLSRNLISYEQKNKKETTRLIEILDEIIKKEDYDFSVKASRLKDILITLENEGLSSKNIQNLLFKRFDDLIIFINNIGLIPNDINNKIPYNFKKRYISDNSFERIELIPAKDLSIPKNLKDFVKSVERFFPDASGMPIIQFNAGKVVIDSFIKAFSISFVFLIFFLILIFRNYKLVLLCIFSLMCGFILTIFFMIIAKINLNFANMISIPLIFSLGISYPIYFLKRFLELKDLKKVFESNTPAAILFSGLTTIFSFSTLYISSHQGTSSMGLLLFISLSNTLISSLILLPIFINKFKLK